MAMRFCRRTREAVRDKVKEKEERQKREDKNAIQKKVKNARRNDYLVDLQFFK